MPLLLPKAKLLLIETSLALRGGLLALGEQVLGLVELRAANGVLGRAVP